LSEGCYVLMQPVLRTGHAVLQAGCGRTEPTANTQPEQLDLAVLRDYVEGMAPTPGTQPQGREPGGCLRYLC